MTDAPFAETIEYGVTPLPVMAAMTGLDFVRAIFDGRLPAPPIMETILPHDSAAESGAVAFSTVPGLRHYNPIGSVHGGYAATLLDSAMGLAIHTMLPAGIGYSTLEFKVSFIRGMTTQTGPVPPRARYSMSASVRPPPRRGSSTARAGCWPMPPRRA